MEVNKIEIIARRVFGWKLHSVDKWYDVENDRFIRESEFQPFQQLDHAMLVVERLKKYGFEYKVTGEREICFNNICATGDSLAAAITNAAFMIADNSSIESEWL